MMDTIDREKTGSRGRPRRGAMMVEMTMSVLLLFVSISMMAKIKSASNRYQRQMRHRSVAQLVAANAVERLSLVPYEFLDDLDEAIVPNSSTRLPDSSIDWTVFDHDGGKRVTVRVSWEESSSTRGEVKLTRWRYDPAPQQAGPKTTSQKPDAQKQATREPATREPATREPATREQREQKELRS